MKTNLYFNIISDNLNDAIKKELNDQLPKDIKRIKERNKDLMKSIRHKTKLINRWKKILKENNLI